MNAKDAIRGTMDLAERVFTTYLSDISDGELLTRPAPGANHLAWQIGHLISSEHQLVSSVCPGACPDLPAGFNDQHGKQTVGSDDRSGFLSKDAYLALFEKQRRATKAALEKLPDADLDKTGPKDMARMCPTVGSVFLLAGNHVMMHAGQFATARRVLGKPVLI